MQPPLEGHAQEGEAQRPEPAVANRVPPGFRFHPTDEELVWYYLRPKVADRGPDFPIFGEIEIYKIEPWDLPVMGVGGEHQSYFFAHRKRKYPGGHRAKRTTEAGYWKATGKDKPVYRGRTQIGMKKTLVYYLGRAPIGEKMDWPFWVVIRIQKKKVGPQEGSEHPGEASSRGARAASPLSDDDDSAPDRATHKVKEEPVAETASLSPVGRAVNASNRLLGLLQDPEYHSGAASQTSSKAVASSPSKPTSSWAWQSPQPLVSTLTSGPLQASSSIFWQPQANSAGTQQTISNPAYQNGLMGNDMVDVRLKASMKPKATCNLTHFAALQIKVAWLSFGFSCTSIAGVPSTASAKGASPPRKGQHMLRFNGLNLWDGVNLGGKVHNGSALPADSATGPWPTVC
eukprot:SM000033S12325  [mRNA]  locus=s33:157802:164310:- [translate_table: standard]